MELESALCVTKEREKNHSRFAKGLCRVHCFCKYIKMEFKCLPVGGVTPEDVFMETAVVVTKKGFDYTNSNHFFQQLQKEEAHKWVVFLPKMVIQPRYW